MVARTRDYVGGPFARSFSQLDPNTIMTSAELMNERRNNPDLSFDHFCFFYPANFALYTVEDGQAVLYFGRRDGNPLFADMDEASRQLLNNHFYVPPRDAAELGKTSAVRVALEDDSLTACTRLSYALCMDTYDTTMTPIQQQLAEAAYGDGDAFRQNMHMLCVLGISWARIHVLNPSLVHKEVASGNECVVRAVWVGSTPHYNGGYCTLDATFHDVGKNGFMRGLRREVSPQRPEQRKRSLRTLFW